MRPGWPRLLAAIACIGLSIARPVAAQERPATLDDVLAMETFGAASLSPDGRRLVYERRGPYDQGPRFDLGVRSGWAASSLYLVERDGGEAKPLLSGTGEAGLLLGPWSPDGARLVVYRLHGDQFEAGVVTLADRSVRWTGLTPDWPISGLGAAWLDSTRLALTLRRDHALPLRLRFDAPGGEVMAARWATARSGRAPSRLALETRDGAVTIDEAPAPKALVILSPPYDRPTILFEGPVRDIAPSPDGRWIALFASGDAAAQTEEERSVQSAVLQRTALRFVSVQTGAVTTPWPAADVAPHLLRWSGDSARVLVWRRLPGQTWRAGALAAIGPEGRPDVFASPQLDPWGAGAQLDELRPVRADWLAGRPLLYAAGSDGRFDWWSLGTTSAPVSLTQGLTRVPAAIEGLSDRSFLLFADQGLWSVNGTGRPRRLTSEQMPIRAANQADPMSTLRTRVNDAPRRAWAPAVAGDALQIVDGRDGATTWGTPAPCGGQRRTVAADRRALVWLCVDQGVETLHLATPAGSRIVDHVNPAFAALDLARGRPVEHLDHRGRPVTSLLFLPPGRRVAEVKGVIVLIYPGALDDGQADGLTLHMGLRPQLLAMGDYAVLSAALPGAGDSADGALFDDVAAGIDLAVSALMAAEPDLAAKRIAVAGHSFGGYAALAAATRAGRYAAYVAWAAPTDPASRWGEPGPGGWRYPQERLSFGEAAGSIERGQFGLGGPPWVEPSAYLAASPVQAAAKINAPVLLITADRDYVPSSQAYRMFAALRRLGKPARLVTYWGEGHDNASPANIRDAYAQIFAFLDASFTPDPASGASDPPRL